MPEKEKVLNNQGQEVETTTTTNNHSKDIVLEREWCWYFDAPPAGATAKQYEESVKTLGTFDTVQDFWRYWNNFQTEKFPDYSNLRLFKKGVAPKYEDPENRDGGKWMINVPKVSSINTYLELVLSIIGEEFAFSEEITGVVISIRPRMNCLSIWNRNAQLKPAVQSIGGELERIFVPAYAVNYLIHKVTTSSSNNSNQKGSSRRQRSSGGGRSGGGGKHKRSQSSATSGSSAQRRQAAAKAAPSAARTTRTPPPTAAASRGKAATGPASLSANGSRSPPPRSTPSALSSSSSSSVSSQHGSVAHRRSISYSGPMRRMRKRSTDVTVRSIDFDSSDMSFSQRLALTAAAARPSSPSNNMTRSAPVTPNQQPAGGKSSAAAAANGASKSGDASHNSPPRSPLRIFEPDALVDSDDEADDGEHEPLSIPEHRRGRLVDTDRRFKWQRLHAGSDGAAPSTTDTTDERADAKETEEAEASSSSSSSSSSSTTAAPDVAAAQSSLDEQAEHARQIIADEAARDAAPLGKGKSKGESVLPPGTRTKTTTTLRRVTVATATPDTSLSMHQSPHAKHFDAAGKRSEPEQLPMPLLIVAAFLGIAIILLLYLVLFK